MPIWAYVELGHPLGTNGGQITPDQAAAAVWSSLIHGARGIVYFNHSFGGSCQTQHILRDTCYTHDARADHVTEGLDHPSRPGAQRPAGRRADHGQRRGRHADEVVERVAVRVRRQPDRGQHDGTDLDAVRRQRPVTVLDENRMNPKSGCSPDSPVLLRGQVRHGPTGTSSSERIGDSALRVLKLTVLSGCTANRHQRRNPTTNLWELRPDHRLRPERPGQRLVRKPLGRRHIAGPAGGVRASGGRVTSPTADARSIDPCRGMYWTTTFTARVHASP